jgi:hypothetical protein
MGRLVLEDLLGDLSEEINFSEDELLLDTLNVSLIDVNPMVRAIPGHRRGVILEGGSGLFALPLFFPPALLLLTSKHLIFVLRRKRYKSPYDKYLDVTKIDYRDILDPIRVGKPLTIVARVDGEIVVFHLFQYFEVDSSKPDVETRGSPITVDEFMSRLNAIRMMAE